MNDKDSKYTTIPYENTVYTILISEIKGKYFQNIVAPHLIAHFPENAGIHLIENNQLSAWFPIRERWGDISLEEFNQYAEITKEQFKEYEAGKSDLSKIILAHKDAPIFREDNKANLSEPKNVKYSTYQVQKGDLVDGE